ncbi:hypothetical protein Adu01nite_86380 [Paractinoplanes durhamensis]|uniref:Uncharacterized protein n=1 Tax=Paractinoplanes durhamensis TaxID=113563 RepID=A0ABQ3ZBS7_9ACTN|nr:hypothetical protein Adu01nite_86380 [Actinoplanes durhamensis]
MSDPMEDARVISSAARYALRKLEDAVLDASDRERRLAGLDGQIRTEAVADLAERVPAFGTRVPR